MQVHYFGCGVVQAASAKENNQGTYVGAVAIKIGDVSIEIVGNNLTTIQGTSQLSYAPDYYNDMAMGPFELAGSTATVIVERESVPTNGLWKTYHQDRQLLASGALLYRWTITTSDGVLIHSHGSSLSLIHI